MSDGKKSVLAALVKIAPAKRDDFDRDQWRSEVVIHFVTWTDGKVRNANALYDDGLSPLFLDDLEFQFWGRTERDSGFHWYGDELRYRAYSVTQRDAARMVKTFKTVERRIAKITQVEGHTRSCEEHANRFCRALGIKLILFPTTEHGSSYHSNVYRAHEIGSGTDQLRYELDKVAKDATAKRAMATAA